MVGASTDGLDIGSVVLVEIDHDWSIGDGLGGVTTLTEIVVTPSEYFTVASGDQGVSSSA